MVTFYKIAKKKEKIQLTKKNKIDLNNRKMKNNPPAPEYIDIDVVIFGPAKLLRKVGLVRIEKEQVTLFDKRETLAQALSRTRVFFQNTSAWKQIETKDKCN